MGIGLVDELGSLELALARALELAGLPPARRPGLESYQPEPALLDRVLAGLLRGAASARTTPMPALVERLQPLLGSAARTLDGSVQFHLPLNIWIE